MSNRGDNARVESVDVDETNSDDFANGEQTGEIGREALAVQTKSDCQCLPFVERRKRKELTQLQQRESTLVDLRRSQRVHSSR